VVVLIEGASGIWERYQSKLTPFQLSEFLSFSPFRMHRCFFFPYFTRERPRIEGMGDQFGRGGPP